MSYDYSSDYVRHFPKLPERSLEDDLIAECKRLEAENATLKATIEMVRRVLDATAGPGDRITSLIIDALGDVR